MARGYRLTYAAQQDLVLIKRYTDQNWGPEQTRKYLTNIRATLELLAAHPKQGVARPEVGTDVFSFPCGNHVLYYRLEQTGMVVFAVLHQRMAPSHHLPKR